MATTKYIVNNVPGQTINGNLTVTGTTTGLLTYKALLTQLGSQTGTTLSGFGGFNDGLIIGETYTITDYVSDDDFSNIANVISGGVLTYSYSGTSVTGLTSTYTSEEITEVFNMFKSKPMSREEKKELLNLLKNK